MGRPGEPILALGRLSRAASAAALCLAAALELSACGSAATGAGAPAVVAPPAAPTARSCGVDGALRRAAPAPRRKKQSPTPPGTYRYRTRGVSGVPSEAVRARSLPRFTDLIATRSRRFGSLICFRLQKRYAPDLANTETYLIRGDELFLVALRVEALGQSQEVRPVPAVLFGNGSGTRWSGQFGGATSGSYDVTALGERVYRLGGRRLKVTGLRSSVTYRGAVSGIQKMTAWISPAHRLVLSERVALRERIGVNELHLHLRRRLADLDPFRTGRP